MGFCGSTVDTRVDIVKRLFAHILNVRINTIGSDPLGALRDGSMFLICRCLLRITRQGEKGPFYLKEQHRIAFGPDNTEQCSDKDLFGKELKFQLSIHWDSSDEKL